MRVTGSDLASAAVAEVAGEGARVEIDPEADVRIEKARAMILAALATGEPVYGLTTGLGQSLAEQIEPAQAAEFSLQTLRGRAVSVGEPLERERASCSASAAAPIDTAELLQIASCCEWLR